MHVWGLQGGGGGVLVMGPEQARTEKAAGLHLRKHLNGAISVQLSNIHC